MEASLATYGRLNERLLDEWLGGRWWWQDWNDEQGPWRRYWISDSKVVVYYVACNSIISTKAGHSPDQLYHSYLHQLTRRWKIKLEDKIVLISVFWKDNLIELLYSLLRSVIVRHVHRAHICACARAHARKAPSEERCWSSTSKQLLILVSYEYLSIRLLHSHQF